VETAGRGGQGSPRAVAPSGRQACRPVVKLECTFQLLFTVKQNLQYFGISRHRLKPRHGSAMVIILTGEQLTVNRAILTRILA
jgi:hypothetical protein